jgi:hypothetical protein
MRRSALHARPGSCYTVTMKIAAPRSPARISDWLVWIGLALALAGVLGLAIAYFIPPRGF